MEKLLKDKEDADKVVSYIRKGTEDKNLKEQTSMELYQKVQSPITSKLEKLEHKIMNQNLLSIEDPYYYQNQLEDPYYDQHFIEAQKQKHLQLIY